MAVKSIIDIPINDEAFKRFLELFKEYSDKLEDMPESWQALGASMGAAGDAFGKSSAGTKEALAIGATSAGLIVEELQKASHAQQQFHSATRKSETGLKRVAHVAGGLGKTLLGITSKMLAFGVAGAGIGAIASGFGIEDLAKTGMSKMRSARSMGLSVGAMNSWSVNTQAFSNTGFLQNLANAKATPQEQQVFGMLGISDWQKKSVPALGREAILHERAGLVAGGPNWRMSAAGQAAAMLGQSTAQMRVIRDTPLSQINAAFAADKRDKGNLGFDSKAGYAWSQELIQFEKTGITIQSSLIKTLAPLAPQFTALGKEVAGFVTAFGKSGDAKLVVADFTKALAQGVQFLGSPAFMADLQKFQSGIGTAAREVVAVAKLLEPLAKVAMLAEGMHKANRKTVLSEWGNAVGDYRAAQNYFKTGEHNPGNLRHQDKIGAWVDNRYKTESAGLRAMSQTLGTYPTAHRADTIASIIPIYNGHGANDAQYERRVARWSGFKADQHLNLGNPTTRAKLMQAMIREETSRKTEMKTILASMGVHPTTGNLPASVGSTAPSATHDPQLADLLKRLAKQRLVQPVHVSVNNSTSARIAVSANAVSH